MSPRMGRTGGAAARAMGRFQKKGVIALLHDLWTWGYNAVGNLGDGTTVSKISPISVGGSVDWSRVEMSYVTFGIKTDGTFWVWGDDTVASGYGGGLGTGGGYNNYLSTSSPVQIGALTTWASVIPNRSFYTVQVSHHFALKSTGVLYGTGAGYDGALGLGHTSHVGTWTQTATGVARAAAGYVSSAYIDTSGYLYASGGNALGQLGFGNTTGVTSWSQVGGDTWSRIGMGMYSTLGIKSNGTLWSWGWNGNGALGYSTNELVVNGCCVCDNGWQNGYEDPYYGCDSQCTNTGGTYSYYNCYVNTNRTSPTQIGSDTTWAELSTGAGSCAAIKTDGTLWMWGNNGLVQQATPLQVGSDTNWSKVSTTATHTIGLKTNGTVWGWGPNSNGQVGDGTTTTRSSPVQIGALNTWTQITAGNYHSAAIT